ncbi:MAG: hypothetical protein HYV14_02135 [Elusimicrobia bacterium]|nr:hypothetical protein [Elusimicrobiota bacterium]
MKSEKRELYFVATILAVTLAAGGYFAYRHRAPSQERVAAHTAAWLDGPRATAKVMIERYGSPNALGEGTVTWYERGPWKRITVRGGEHFDYLEQTVGYFIPGDAVPALREFGHGLTFDRFNDELTAVSNSEALNILALNMADEIASARRGAKEASELYVRTAKLAAAGKSSPKLDRLQFEPYRPTTETPWNREIGY